MKISPKARQKILDKIDFLFDSAKARLLGRFFKGPALFFEVAKQTDPLDTIEGAYKFTMAMLYGAPPTDQDSEEQMKDLADVTNNYLESHKLKVKNQVIDGINRAEDPKEAVKNIKETMSGANNYLSKLIANEVRVVQAYAEKEGIARVGASLGEEDPTVVKYGVIDEKMCETCKSLWHSESNLRVPKLYKLSELQEGYMKDHKNPYPTVGPSHPNCRHVLTMVPKMFGPDDTGKLVFKGFDYDAYLDQKNKGK